jgi:cell wall-associated NlpC family hydrolase
MRTPAEVIAIARSLLGTPFHHQGRVPGVGVDCAGVPIVVARTLGLVPENFDVAGYPPIPDGSSLRVYCEANMIRWSYEEPGGAVLIAWKDGPPQHLGIVAQHPHGGLSIIHADSVRQKRVIETRLEWSRYMRRVQAYRLPGVAY